MRCLSGEDSLCALYIVIHTCQHVTTKITDITNQPTPPYAAQQSRPRAIAPPFHTFSQTKLTQQRNTKETKYLFTEKMIRFNWTPLYSIVGIGGSLCFPYDFLR